MSDLWFVEERAFDGRWTPVTYHGAKPSGKRLDGPDKAFKRDPVLVPADHHHLTLKQLQAVYGTDGAFRFQQQQLYTNRKATAYGVEATNSQKGMR